LHTIAIELSSTKPAVGFRVFPFAWPSDPPALLDQITDGDFASQLAAFPKLADLGDDGADVGLCGGDLRYEPGDRPAVVGDLDLFAPGHPVKKLGQVRLGFVGADGIQKASLTSEDWSDQTSLLSMREPCKLIRRNVLACLGLFRRTHGDNTALSA